MKLLLLILSIMTFTVESKNTVKGEGEYPYDMEVNYACTYQKGQVRAGDTATLTLSHLEGIALESVQVYLRSNNTAGAGILTMTIDGQEVYNNSGSYQSWFGAYDNTNYQPLGKTFTNQIVNNELKIQLVGTVNSLYIQKYEIQYTLNPPHPKTVSLYTEGQLWNTLTESWAGEGVTLPACQDKEGWHFYGWATEDLTAKTTDQPMTYKPNQLLIPDQDMTLYAVWRNQDPIAHERLGELRSGYYVLEHQDWNSRLYGPVSNGIVPLIASSSDIAEDDVYYVDFNTTDSICTIRHNVSNTYIGYAESALSSTPQAWQCYLLPDSTFLFYCHPFSKYADVLYPNINTNTEACLFNAILSRTVTRQWALYEVFNTSVPVYWYSYPSLTPIILPQAEQHTYTIPFGIYEIYIQNGKKSIRLHQ